MAQASSSENKDLFNKLKSDLLNVDPIYWAENHLMLDGKPFRVHGSGYKPFSDIYRYMGIKALEPTAKPLIIVAGRQVGKDLDINTSIPTPSGWKTMADLQVGDMVFDENGDTCDITWISPIFTDHKCYELTFDDGTKIVAGEDHQWLTNTEKEIEAKIRTTKEIFSSINERHSIRTPAAKTSHKYIVSCVEVPTVPTKCISVNSPSNLYLASKSFIPTHNTTMASILEMYFMGSGIFGNGTNPPIRVLHTFPHLELAFAYSKTKLSQMISSAVPAEGQSEKKSGKVKSCMQALLDQTTATNDSLNFKQFSGGNHLWIESVGLNADRIMGRQLSLETELPTPTGFIKLKDLKLGDQLFDESGNICNVSKLYPINISPESYRITFDDGTVVEACADHLWQTYTRNDRVKLQRFLNGTRKCPPSPTIKSTKELLETLKDSSGKESNHSIPNCLPLNYSEKDLPLDPYLFGLWLGDGCQKGVIESADPEIFDGFEHRIVPSSINQKGGFAKNGAVSRSNSYRVIGLTTKLEEIKQFRNTHSGIGDFYNKHIPDIYMQAPFEQRLALLQGLLDTDGHCDKLGNIEFVQVRKELALQVYDLVLSLGIKAYFYKRESWRYDIRYKDKYRVRFMTRLPVFRMKRKLARIKTSKNALTKSTHRFIRSIEPIDSIPMRCIAVDSPSHLFLITRACIATHNSGDVMIFDEVQSTTSHAIGNALKILTTAKYGPPSKGVQVYVGTPRGKGSDFHKLWLCSSQQYFYLGCEQCKEHFPLYTPGSDDWKSIWIYGMVVKCPKCGHEQNKLEAQERGKWVPIKDPNDPDCKMIGFHVSQIYMPMFTRESIINEMPGIHPTNTERTFMNEVLGEFFQGDSSPITPEEIRENCADVGRKFCARIDSSNEEDKDQLVVMGIDYGARADLEQMANTDKIVNRGQSYSTAIILSAKGAGRLSIEFCTKFKRNDMESKKGLIDQLMRQYSVQLAVGDIGFSQDFSSMLHNSYGDRYLVSRAHNKVNGHVKFSVDAFPKEIVFERDHYIGELFEQMKKGMIRFPFGDYEKIAWLIDHCSSMEIKPSISRGGDPSIHYVKGGSPNDGLMGLLNAYIAYKFLLTNGFTNNNPLLHQQDFKQANKPLVMTGVINRMI